MKKLRDEFSLIMKNERGVALMMIMTSIIILMAIYGEFTFDSKISRIKATNILDRSQAKLLAESGLQLAMARLRLYKEAYNKVQGNQTAKGAVNPQLLNTLWEVPFMFPIPITPNATAAFKSTVDKFQTESLLDGEMKVNIQNISSRMNLNLIRMDMMKFDPQKADENNSQLNMSDTAISNDVSIDQALYFLLKRQVDEKKEKDESFDERNGNINYQELVTNLKYYISDFGNMAQDPYAGEAENIYQRIPLSPKFGPFSSASELYSIPGWNDELIELVQNEFSVYPAAQIDLNKMTANMLRILIPNIDENQIKEFFEYRDDPETPKYFNNKQDFKKYITEIGRIMGPEEFDQRMKLFEDKGISFGSNPSLFKIVAEGTYNRSTYTLVAFVTLGSTTPSTPQQPATNTDADGDGVIDPPAAPKPPVNPGGDANTSDANQTAQLLEPRIIEIQVN